MPNARSILAQTAHRPSPPPRRPWAMRMTWRRLLFAHWPVDARALRPFIPAPLAIEEHGGTAWVGVIPFLMDRVRPHFLPPLPPTHRFGELNVRTYVTDGRQPGVWFFSLDAASRLAVEVARRTFHLNYLHAKMTIHHTEPDTHYDSHRTDPRPPTTVLSEAKGRIPPRPAPAPARFRATYRPIGEPFHAAPDSLAAFLTERYCLYAADRRGRVYRGEIHHAPWPLQPARLDARANTMADPLGLALDGEPHLLYAHALDVLAWPIRRLRST